MNSINQNKKTVTRLIFKDILGREKCVLLTPSQTSKALHYGIKVDGSDIIGLTAIFDCEYNLIPDIQSKTTISNDANEIVNIYQCRVTNSEGINLEEIADELMSAALDEAKMLGFNENYHKLMETLFPNSDAIPWVISN
jgi:glutamine synthetase